MFSVVTSFAVSKSKVLRNAPVPRCVRVLRQSKTFPLVMLLVHVVGSKKQTDAANLALVFILAQVEDFGVVSEKWRGIEAVQV